MKILVVTHYMPPHDGGIERVAAGLAEGLASRGHDVAWVSSATPLRPGERADLDGRGGEVVRGWRVRVAAWNVLERRFGLPYPLWGPGAMATLAAMVPRFDVVHAHDCLYLGSVTAAAACRVARVPLVVTQHVARVPFGRAVDAVQEAAYATLGRLVLRQADAVVACSAHVAEWAFAMGLRAPVDLVPNGVDARFRPAGAAARAALRAAWGVPVAAKVALFVGRLVPKKGLDLVCAAQRVLASEGVSLIVVGDGPRVTDLAGLARCVHHSRVPNERMQEMYGLADAFVLPSRGEGFPLSVQEAMTSGLPVVVSCDPSYRTNLEGAPGVDACDDVPGLVRALRGALARGPSADVAAWARTRWGSGVQTTAYERILERVVARTRA